MFENKVLRRIFVLIANSRRIRWAVHLAQMGEKKNVYV
jgi:hypothetical protein